MPVLSATENVAIPLLIKGVPRKQVLGRTLVDPRAVSREEIVRRETALRTAVSRLKLAQAGLVQALGHLVALYKALGGGWVVKPGAFETQSDRDDQRPNRPLS